MENATLVELKTNRELLDPNFSGYKLSLDPIPLHETTLPAKVDHLLRSEEQFSLQHVKLFGLHNHLLYDPWNLDDVYYIDKDKTVKRNVLNKETGKLSGVSKVWDIPSTHERRAGHYSPSGCFPAKDLVLLSDGAGTLHLIHTGERVKSDKGESQWKVLFTSEVCGEGVSYVVVNARSFEEEKDESKNVIEGRKVHCLLLHVEEAKKVKGQKVLPQVKVKGSHTSFVSVLEWISLEEDKDGSWSVGRVRKLCGSAIPEYAAVCKDGISLTISSEEPFIFITDTEKPLYLNNGCTGIVWTETLDEVRLTLPLGRTVAENKGIDVHVHDGNMVTVTIQNRVLLRGCLHRSLDHDLTTWEVKDNRLMVTFHKREKGFLWKRIVDQGEPRGVERIDPALGEEARKRIVDQEEPRGVERVDPALGEEARNRIVDQGEPRGVERVDPALEEEARNRVVDQGEPRGVGGIDPTLGEEAKKLLAHLTSEFQETGAGTTPVFNSEELEDCDEVSTKDASLSRFDGEIHAVTHKAIISQWLFNVQLDPDAMPVICLRDGLDGLLWQPKCNKLSQEEAKSKQAEEIWDCSHVASFMTFGYVQASKERKKFNICATDTSYVAVCEASTYIYIYRQPAELSQDTELRNRRTGEKVSHVARQQLITLPNAQEVLGVHASSTTLYVLMEDKLLAYVLNQ